MTAIRDMSPDQLARACADSMWAADKVSQALGMVLADVAAGRAVVSMRVREDMCNGQGNCHGGMIFTLADSAFAFACNAYNQFTVAAHCNISFISAVEVDEMLTATAVERQRSGRSGIFDVAISRADGAVIAEFRGNSRTVKGQHLADSDLTDKQEQT